MTSTSKPSSIETIWKFPSRSRRLRSWLNWLVHSLVYFAASLAALALFYVLLMLAESAWYALTEHAVSVWAMAMAAFAASLLFSPIVHMLQGMIDRLFYRRRIDPLQAIRELGADALHDTPPDRLELFFLQRLSEICQRQPLLLDEGERRFLYPEDARIDSQGEWYELALPMEYRHMHATLYLGFRRDGWMADAQEVASLGSVVRIAGISLEHARLTLRQVEAARLDSLTRIAAQLHSHDLKNRLNDLVFLAHHLQSGQVDAEELPRLAQAVTKVVHRMQAIMQRMADPHAPLRPRLQPAELASLLRRLVDNQLWPEGVHVHCRLQEPVMARIDENMLESVLNNLFDNAIQAMDKQGELHIHLRSDGQRAEILVQDDGCGMDEDFLRHRLFQLFASDKADGLGIGLYLSRRMIEAQQGELRAKSEGKGKGSTFIISLPLWQGEAPAS